MKTVGVVTVGRSDYGIYLPILRAIGNDPELRLHMYVSGMHLSPEFGHTVDLIEADGFEIIERCDCLLSSDTPAGIAKSMGLGVVSFAQAYTRSRPDILMVLGDRFEMCAAALAALPFIIPVAHIHGGEITRGAIDDSLRHCMTKLSHLHFVSTEEYAQRVIQLGEEPWRVVVCGAPSLDNLCDLRFLTRKELATSRGLALEDDFLLVTYHPVTLEYERTEWQVRELLAALTACQMPVVFTMANADTNGRIINKLTKEFVGENNLAQSVDNLGTEAYFSVMALATAMVGNSSSGIIEAASVGLPVVNIGIRQQGRVRGLNVIDVGYAQNEIMVGISQAMEPAFREKLRGVPNVYSQGSAAQTIVSTLKNLPLEEKTTMKRFHDMGESRVSFEEGVSKSSQRGQEDIGKVVNVSRL